MISFGHPLKTYFLYILSCSDKTLYTGITVSIERRLHEHNYTKKGAKYTKSRRPVHLLASWTFKDLSSALKAERKIKKLSHDKKILAVKSGILPFEFSLL